MRLYRICHVRYLEDLRGLGASYRDGARWNEPGFPIVYFAETPSVAMLEMAHYLPSPRLAPPGYRLVSTRWTARSPSNVGTSMIFRRIGTATLIPDPRGEWAPCG